MKVSCKLTLIIKLNSFLKNQKYLSKVIFCSFPSKSKMKISVMRVSEYVISNNCYLDKRSSQNFISFESIKNSRFSDDFRGIEVN